MSEMTVLRENNHHAVPERESALGKVVNRDVPEKVTLIRDLKEVEEGTKQRPRGRAGLVYSETARPYWSKSEKR